jgi:hypothetical protein
MILALALVCGGILILNAAPQKKNATKINPKQ